MNTNSMKAGIGALSGVALLATGFVTALAVTPASAAPTQVGDVLVCYTCSATGNAAVDAALAANPGVSSDGILFAFVNTSSAPIAGGTFEVIGTSPSDSFALPTIAANSTYILIPGVTDDGQSHHAGGLFELTGVKDTSDGAGGVNDTSSFILTASKGRTRSTA